MSLLRKLATKLFNYINSGTPTPPGEATITRGMSGLYTVVITDHKGRELARTRSQSLHGNAVRDYHILRGLLDNPKTECVRFGANDVK